MYLYKTYWLYPLTPKKSKTPWVRNRIRITDHKQQETEIRSRRT
jgi:hypothetical protein